jgi:hypothetical protein
MSMIFCNIFILICGSDQDMLQIINKDLIS